MKKLIVGLVIVILVVLGIYFITKSPANTPVTPVPDVTTPGNIPLVTSTTTLPTPTNPDQTVIGQSVEGRDIVAYHYGQGATELLFIGGIHGGYEWNTALVAYQTMDYLKRKPGVIPSNVKVTVIPVLNPDGLAKVIGTTTTGIFSPTDVASSQETQVAGRFNGNKVDLNRNFDCDWQTSATWQNKKVSGGTAAFSEPESRAIKNYVETSKPKAVVTWYSSAGGVFASSCHNGVSPETNTLTKTFAKASGYPPHESFDFYAITGDLVNWLAKENIPAISVLLTNHTDTEWSKNQAGIEAVLKYYARTQ